MNLNEISEQGKLYFEYIDYEYEKRNLFNPPMDFGQCMYELILSCSYQKWYDVYTPTNELVGFAVISLNNNSDFNFDYEISDAFVRKKHRGKGYMTKTISEFVKNHKGKYLLHILKCDDIAIKFWNDLFKKLGYKRARVDKNIEAIKDYGAFCYVPN